MNAIGSVIDLQMSLMLRGYDGVPRLAQIMYIMGNQAVCQSLLGGYIECVNINDCVSVNSVIINGKLFNLGYGIDEDFMQALQGLKRF